MQVAIPDTTIETTEMNVPNPRSGPPNGNACIISPIRPAPMTAAMPHIALRIKEGSATTALDPTGPTCIAEADLVRCATQPPMAMAEITKPQIHSRTRKTKYPSNAAMASGMPMIVMQRIATTSAQRDDRRNDEREDQRADTERHRGLASQHVERGARAVPERSCVNIHDAASAMNSQANAEPTSLS